MGRGIRVAVLQGKQRRLCRPQRLVCRICAVVSRMCHTFMRWKTGAPSHVCTAAAPRAIAFQQLLLYIREENSADQTAAEHFWAGE